MTDDAPAPTRQPLVACSTCRFFEATHAECRLMPPQVVTDEREEAFPAVAPGEWCGQHEESRESSQRRGPPPRLPPSEPEVEGRSGWALLFVLLLAFVIVLVVLGFLTR